MDHLKLIKVGTSATISIMGIVEEMPNHRTGFSSLRSLRSLHDVTKPASGWQRVGLHSPMAYLTLGSPQSGSPSLLAHVTFRMSSKETLFNSTRCAPLSWAPLTNHRRVFPLRHSEAKKRRSPTNWVHDFEPMSGEGF